MDTLKKDSCRKIVFVVLLVLSAGVNVLAQQKQPAQVLIDSYKPANELTPERIISDLNQALALCTDDELRFRIEYRIGILYFKDGYFSQALDSFKKVAQSNDCPELVRLCSLNMAGEIYRMQAKDDKALKAFEELVKQSQKFLTRDSNLASPSTVLRLAAAACVSRAEIYQYAQDYDSAIVEYEKIITCLKSCKVPDINAYAPLALDRISQLDLIKDEVEDYNQTAIELVEKYPDYYRTPIVRFEIEAVRILKQDSPNLVFIEGSFEAPAKLITFLKNSKNKPLMQKVTVFLKKLINQYQYSYGGILLSYHYAWLLEVSGEQKQAVEVLEDISKQAAAINTDMSCTASVIQTLAGYAKLQQAIILGEENEYRQALEVAYSLRPDPNDAHIQNLSDSIKKALETLNREVPKNVNNQ